MRKGQIQIIFTWIFILILAVAILFYGIKTVRKTQELGENVLVVNFFKSLEDKIDKYYFLGAGSSKVEQFNLPGNIKYVCFIKNDNFNNMNIYTGTIIDDYNAYINSLKTYKNVLLIPALYSNSNANISNIVLDKNPVCLKLENGFLKIRFETKENGVSVTNA